MEKAFNGQSLADFLNYPNAQTGDAGEKGPA